MEQSGKQQSPINGGVTKANTHPNPNLQTRKPEPTYRARSATAPPNSVSATKPKDVLMDRTQARYQTEQKRQRIRLALILTICFLVLGGTAAYAFVWSPLKKISETINTTIISIAQTPAPDRIVSADGTDVTHIPKVFPKWREEPMNILLLGVDYRPLEEDSRADTMIVVHVDPVAKTASMLSIPRDLWVRIPGHGEARINAAYQMGESDGKADPDSGFSGPYLAMSTVEQDFGIPIHYYAQVNFDGLERVVDALGGINVDVPKPLVDNEYPLPDYGTTRIYIPAGLQHMNGHTALQYARSRHADSDLGRNSRQQQVLLALKQQGLSLDLIPRLNDLLTQLAGAVQTDMPINSVENLGSLAQLAKEIDMGSIQTMAVGPDCVTETVLESGADVLMPDWACIRPKVQQMFSDPRLANENARILVQNGTTTGGIGGALMDFIVQEGFTVVEVVPAPDQGEHPVTTITDYSGGEKSATIAALAKSMGIDPSDVKQGNSSEAPVATTDGELVDILVIAGDDRIE